MYIQRLRPLVTALDRAKNCAAPPRQTPAHAAAQAFQSENALALAILLQFDSQPFTADAQNARGTRFIAVKPGHNSFIMGKFNLSKTWDALLGAVVLSLG